METEEEGSFALLGARLFDALASGLQAMDLEATTRFRASDGHEWPSGLRHYHEHYRAEARGRRGCEPSWSQRLASLLQASFPSTQAEVRYPGSRQTCDLVVRGAGFGTIYVEIKGAWEVEFWMSPDGPQPKSNPSFKPHIQRALEDSDKVLRLQAGSAQAVGLLLVGFDLHGSVALAASEISAALSDGWRCHGPVVWREPSYGTLASVRLWLRATGKYAQ